MNGRDERIGILILFVIVIGSICLGICVRNCHGNNADKLPKIEIQTLTPEAESDSSIVTKGRRGKNKQSDVSHQGKHRKSKSKSIQTSVKREDKKRRNFLEDTIPRH